MQLKYVLATALALPVAALASFGASAETLAIPNAANAYTGALPVRGLSMADVERRFGAPMDKLPTAGGDTRLHPPINRWRYAGFTVYFERNRVIHSVANAAARPGA
ncbi:hypothetical protein [Dokdonella sp.]|uniref:hypothetical protein n=1 Tax=Dokdonella sp. TaxID=2291710 RepID=UPI0031C0439C|nr:hypothetical protein [Dokdonella sp.]